jgi:hypothetical protein
MADSWDDISSPAGAAPKKKHDEWDSISSPADSYATYAPVTSGGKGGGDSLYPHQSLGDNLLMGVQSLGKGAADILGFPTDVLQSNANAASYIATGEPNRFDLPLSSSNIADTFSRIAKSAGYPVYEEDQMSPAQQKMYRVGEFAGQVPALEVPAIAKAISRSPEAIARATSRVPEAAIRPLPVAEGSTLRSMIGDSAGAAAGGALTNDENDPTKQMLATLLGTTGGHAFVSGVSQLPNVGERFFGNRGLDPNVRRPDGSGFAQKHVNTAAKDIRAAATDPRAAANTIEDNVNYFRNPDPEHNASALPLPTSGIISSDPGLEGLETSMRIKNRTPFIQNDDLLTQAATDRVNQLQDPAADLTAPRAEAQTQRAAAVNPIEQRLSDLENRIAKLDTIKEQAAAPLRVARDTTNQTRASEALDQTLVNDTYLPARTAKNEKFDALDPQGATKVDATGILTQAKKITDENNALRPDEQMPSQFIGKLNGMEDNPSLRSLVDSRKYLSSAYDRAQSSGNYDLADNLAQLKKSINTAIETHPDAKEANDFFRNEYVPVARTGGETEKMFRQIERNPTRSDTQPSDTAKRFLAAPEKIRDLKAVLSKAPDPQKGLNAVGDYLRSDFARSVLNDDGSVNPASAAKWMQNNGKVLAEFPQVRQEFDDLAAQARRGQKLTADTQAALKKAQGDRELAGAEFDRSAAGNLLGKDPRDVARSLLSSSTHGSTQQAADITKAMSRNKAAARGWKAAVSDAIREQVTGAQAPAGRTALNNDEYAASLAKIDALFKKNADLLATIYTPEEMNKLRQAQAVLAPKRNVGRFATAGSNTEDKAALTPETGIRLMTPALTAGKEIFRLKFARDWYHTHFGQGIPEEVVNEIKLKAMLDPDVAIYLLRKEPAAKGEALPRSVINIMQSYGAAVRAKPQGDNHEDK